MIFEWAADVLKRTTNVDDKNLIIEAIKTTKIESIDGPIDFTQEIGATGGTRPVPNVVRTPLSGGQWRKSAKWNYDLVLCSNKNWPMVPVASPGGGAPVWGGGGGPGGPAAPLHPGRLPGRITEAVLAQMPVPQPVKLGGTT
jgi:hypothetical protein